MKIIQPFLSRLYFEDLYLFYYEESYLYIGSHFPIFSDSSLAEEFLIEIKKRYNIGVQTDNIKKINYHKVKLLSFVNLFSPVIYTNIDRRNKNNGIKYYSKKEYIHCLIEK